MDCFWCGDTRCWVRGNGALIAHDWRKAIDYPFLMLDEEAKDWLLLCVGHLIHGSVLHYSLFYALHFFDRKDPPFIGRRGRQISQKRGVPKLYLLLYIRRNESLLLPWPTGTKPDHDYRRFIQLQGTSGHVIQRETRFFPFHCILNFL